MIKKINIYNVVCDKCGRGSMVGSYLSGWKRLSFAKEAAENDGFQEIDKKYYCPNCYERNDDDEVVVRE